MDKKTVRYKPSAFDYIELGARAVVRPIDHPDSSRVSNTKPVFTSRVVAIGADGSFETLNTIYVKDTSAQ